MNGVITKAKSFFLLQKDKFIKSSVWQKVFFILSCLTVAFITLYTFTVANHRTNSDFATANMLAEAIVREGTIFPKSWMYGQDLWVFFLHLPIAVMTLFSDNNLMMHSVAAMIFIVMALASCIYFSRKIFLSNAWVIFVPIVFSCISQEYLDAVFGSCAYITPLIYIFFTFAVFACAIDKNFKIKYPIKIILFVLVSVIFGASGIRYTQAVTLPLLGAIVLVFFLENKTNDTLNLKYSVLNVLILCAVTVIAMIAGDYVFERLIDGLSFKEGIAEEIIIDYQNIPSKLGHLLFCLLDISGVVIGYELLTMDGMMSMVSLVMCILLCFIFPIMQFKKYKEEPFYVKLFLIFSALHIAEIVILFVFTNLGDAERYLLTPQFLLFFISAHYIYKYIFPKVNLLQTLTTALMIFLLVLPPMHKISKEAVNHEEIMKKETALVNFLDSNGLEFGFATYWNAARNTLLSNGEVEINSVVFSDYVRPYYWINDTKRYADSVYSGNTFILLENKQDSEYKATKTYTVLGEPIKILTFESYIIYVYDFNIATNNFEGKTPQQ